MRCYGNGVDAMMSAWTDSVLFGFTVIVDHATGDVYTNATTSSGPSAIGIMHDAEARLARSLATPQRPADSLVYTSPMGLPPLRTVRRRMNVEKAV